MKRFLTHCLAVSLVALLAVGAPADVVQTTNPRTGGGSGGGGGGVTIGDAVTGGTANRVLFIDGAGNLADDADMTFVTNTLTATGASFGAATGAANAVEFGVPSGCIAFEGSSADAFETLFCVTNPTALDQMYLLPNTANATSTLFGSGANLDINFNSATAQVTNAFGGASLTLANSGAVELQSFNADLVLSIGGSGTIVGDSIYVSRNVKALTESAATSTAQVSVASGVGTAGIYYYSIFATDNTDQQLRSGRVLFSAVNKAGTETCTLGTPEETVAASTGTLTVAVTCSTAPTNAIHIQLNAVSSLTQTTLEAYSRVDLIGPGQVTPQ